MYTITVYVKTTCKNLNAKLKSKHKGLKAAVGDPFFIHWSATDKSKALIERLEAVMFHSPMFNGCTVPPSLVD